MAETKTTEPEDKKTVVAFVVGLLIGGLLVWAFSGPTADAPTTERAGDDTEKAVQTETKLSTGDTSENAEPEEVAVVAPTLNVAENGSVALTSKKAGKSVGLGAVTYPIEEGWIGVRTYTGERLGYILGVVRFSKRDGLVPSEIALQTATRAGSSYAVVMYTENGDRQFNLASDTQVDKVFSTFTAE